MTDKELEYLVTQEWNSLTLKDQEFLVNQWACSGSLSEYIYEVLGYSDDAGVIKEENMDYDEVEQIFLEHYWYPRRTKEFKLKCL